MIAGGLAVTGAVLLESAWVAALVAVWAWAALRLMPHLAARSRYRVALVSLAAMALAPVMVVTSSGMAPSPWMAWVAAAWMAGLGVSGVRIANSLRSVRRLRLAARPAPHAVRETFQARAAAMGLAGRVALAESDDIEVPCSLGIRSPLVLVPRGLSVRLSIEELDAIFAHELAHVARRDYAWRLLQLASAALLFHHPAAWWLSGIVDREREAACDARAAATVDPLAMAEALAALERGRPGVRRGSAARAPLLDRVALLVRDAEDSAGVRRAIEPVTAAFILVVVGVVCLGVARAGVPAMLPAAMTVPAMMAVGLGLLVGVRHAFEPDHLVAVATLVAGERGTGEAMRLGASWGLGHTASLFALAAGLSLVRLGMPDTLGLVLELSVAAMIVGIGLRALSEALRKGGSGPVQEHSHGSVRHAHATAAAHVHVGGWAIARGPLAVGLVHGLAGSGAVTALAAATLSTLPEQLAFILCFGLGSTIGMAGVAGVAGWPLARLARRPAAMAALSAAAGLFAVVFGAVWAYPLVQVLFA